MEMGNWARATSTSTGNGNLTIASVTGYPTPFDVFGTRQFPYAILDDTTGQPLEMGDGHMSSSTVLVRDKVLATYSSSTYNRDPSGPLTLASGTYRIICPGFEGTTQMGGVAATDSTLGATKYLIGGQWRGQPNVAGAVLSSANMWLFPFLLKGRMKSSGGGVHVGTAATTGTTKNARFGLYTVNANGHPGALLAETAAGVSVASTGFKSASWPSALILPAGWYFFAYSTDSNAGIRGTNAQFLAGLCDMWGVSGGDPTGTVNSISKALTYADTGALFPDPLGTTGLTYNVDWSVNALCPVLVVTS